MNKAIFIDKDGTLIHDVPYNVDPDLIRLEPKADKLKQLIDLGYLLIIISNQAGVAYGYFPERALKRVEKKIRMLLKEKEISLHAFYFCPHHPFAKIRRYAEFCDCRKPKSGMFKRAAQEHQIDLAASWMIGDILDDIEAGKKAGCKTVLINNGNETEWHLNPKRTPDYKANDLGEAAAFILESTIHHEQRLV